MIGVPIKLGGAEITPLISFDYDYLHQQGYTEHGADSLNLKVHEKNANLMRGVAGFKISRRCRSSKRVPVKCEKTVVKKTVVKEPVKEPNGIWSRRNYRESNCEEPVEEQSCQKPKNNGIWSRRNYRESNCEKSVKEQSGQNTSNGLWSRRYDRYSSKTGKGVVEKKSITWVPTFQLTAIREWRSQGSFTAASFEGQSCVFHVKGLNPDRTLISPAAGLTALFNEGHFSMSLDYVGEFEVGGKYRDQNVSLQISVSF
jgi:hypothetical protein